MASYLDTVQTPKMTFARQGASPGAAPSGTSLLWVSSVDGQLYRTGADGFDRCVDQGGVIRHPWSPDSASAWYASTGVTPGAWTLDSGVSVAYLANGYAKLTMPNDNTERKLSAPLTGSSEFDVLARLAVINASDGGWQCYLGLTAAGDHSDLDGCSINANGAVVPMESGSSATSGVNTWTGGCAPGLWLYVWIRLASGILDVFASRDGIFYATLYHVPSTLTPTHVVLDIVPQVSVQGEDFVALDYIALGNSTPAGQ